MTGVWPTYSLEIHSVLAPYPLILVNQYTSYLRFIRCQECLETKKYKVASVFLDFLFRCSNTVVIAMASFSFIRLIRWLSVVVLAFAIFIYAPPVEKRATQVSLVNYTFSNNVLAGSINVSYSHVTMTTSNFVPYRYRILPLPR
jgi:hypothetical protein